MHGTLNETSTKLLARARAAIPAGVNSPVRAWRAVGGEPRFIVRGRGAYIWDADGNEFVDLVCAYGPLIAGHAHPDVLQSLTNAARRGAGYGAPTPVEVDLAEVQVACALVANGHHAGLHGGGRLFFVEGEDVVEGDGHWVHHDVRSVGLTDVVLIFGGLLDLVLVACDGGEADDCQNRGAAHGFSGLVGESTGTERDVGLWGPRWMRHSTASRDLH